MTFLKKDAERRSTIDERRVTVDEERIALDKKRLALEEKAQEDSVTMCTKELDTQSAMAAAMGALAQALAGFKKTYGGSSNNP